MAMAQIVEKLAAEQRIEEAEEHARTQNMHGFDGNHLERARVEGIVSVTIQMETGSDGVLGTVQLNVADVGGKFLTSDLLRVCFYQINQLGRLVDGQRTKLDRLVNTNRSDEQHDDNIAQLTAALLRNEENLMAYMGAFERLERLYLAFTGDRWTPPPGRVNENAKLQTAARLDAKAALERLAKERPIRQAPAVKAAAPAKGSAAERIVGFFRGIFGR